jgi:ATP-dependent Clp protease adaptor protein ClpS
MSEERTDGDQGVLLSTRKKVKRPDLYAVVLHNDDYTPQEFVVIVLKTFFRKTDTDARQIMLTVHHKGSGIAGTYTRDIAESKVAQVSDFARDQGAPLRLTVESI